MDVGIQVKYVLGSHSVVGDPRRKWEDRVYSGEITRDGFNPLLVGIVADGVGNADLGARGAQLAIDVVFKRLQQSCGENIPNIIVEAIEAANSRVFEENVAQESEGLTTLVMAVVYNNRCYIGNVGDSRAYWIQQPIKGSSDGKVLPLTRDHSYYNFYGGVPDTEEAGILVNAIGKKDKVLVDLGFYLKGEDFNQANLLGVMGLPLQLGDTILLCSDGLIKTSPEGIPYINEKEMLEALKTEREPNRAAIKVVSFAEGRRPDDNVSAVTIQCLPVLPVSSPVCISLQQIMGILQKIFDKYKKTPIPLAVVTMSMLMICFVGYLAYLALWRIELAQGNLTPTLIQTEVSNGLGSVPTQFPFPTGTSEYGRGSARVQEVFGDSGTVVQGQSVGSDERLASGNTGIRLAIETKNGTGIIHLFENSIARIVYDDKIQPVLVTGAIYVQPASGDIAEIHFNMTNRTYVRVIDGRIILKMTGKEVWVYCFSGECEWKTFDLANQIGIGKKMFFLINLDGRREFKPPVPMIESEIQDWKKRCYLCMGE